MYRNKCQREYFKFYYWKQKGRLGLGCGMYIALPLYIARFGDYNQYFAIIQMQGSPPTTNILRNSYGYQMTDPPTIRPTNTKGFPMAPQQHYHHATDSFTSSIKQLENKLEGVESLVKKKSSLIENPTQPPPTRPENIDNRFRNQYAFNAPEEPLSEQLLRGSCQNFIRKLDYSNLRNTTHFNQPNKPNNHQEIRRSPGGQDPSSFRNSGNGKMLGQESPNPPVKAVEKKLLENKLSFLANNQSKSTPIATEKIVQQKSIATSRTPAKYKTLFDSSPRAAMQFKINSEIEERKSFKNLTEICENKTREREKPQHEVIKNIKRSEVLNGFQFGKSVGKGKFGEVYLARHEETGFIAAIKKIEKSKVKEFKMVDQFVKEIRLHSCLDHPNIVKFFGVFDEGNNIFLVMEYLNGGTLFDCLNDVTCLGIKETVEYLRDIIQALTYMHQKSIAHRDIKPQNIVISSQGVAKLCDFGWSAVVETSRKTYCGTFDYAPPEILQRKNYDTSVDIWCIGVLTYELLTGRVPFEGDKRNIIMQKILNVDKNKIDYPIDLPPQAKEFIECLVQKDPALRPKCHELLKFRLFTMHLSKGMKGKKMQ